MYDKKNAGNLKQNMPLNSKYFANSEMAPSHYLNQCLFIISRVLWHSPETNFIGSTRGWICKLKLKNILVKLYPDSKVHGANIGPTWVLWAPCGPHGGPINLAIRVTSISPRHQWIDGTLSIHGPMDIQCQHVDILNTWFNTPVTAKICQVRE